MNRYPLWKYVLIGIALTIGLFYTLPNFFGEVPAVQISPAKTTAKVDETLLSRVDQALSQASIKPDSIFLDSASIKVRLANTDSTQLITLNPRNGDMWWFIAVNGRFDEVQMRATRDGQAFGVDRELLLRLYGPLAELPLYVFDHIEFLPEPAPTPTPEDTPVTQPTAAVQ